MGDERFPIAAADLRNTIARAVAPVITSVALTMLQAADLVLTYEGHDGRGSGTDEWELRVNVPIATAGTIDDMNALKAAITETVNTLIPRRNEIANVLVLVSGGSSPPTLRSVDSKLIDEAQVRRGVARNEAIEDVKQFLRAFPDAIFTFRQGRPKKPSNLRPRPAYRLDDEYDVQDLLWYALKMKYRTAQREDPTRKNTGSSSRIDFTLGSPSFGIEVKFMRPDAGIGDMKRQLLQDLHDTAFAGGLTDLFFFVVETKSGTCQEIDELDGKADGGTTSHVVRVCI
jgi:hypothetical protein